MYVNGYEIIDVLRIKSELQVNLNINPLILKYFKYDLKCSVITETCNHVETHFNNGYVFG